MEVVNKLVAGFIFAVLISGGCTVLFDPTCELTSKLFGAAIALVAGYWFILWIPFILLAIIFCGIFK